MNADHKANIQKAFEETADPRCRVSEAIDDGEIVFVQYSGRAQGEETTVGTSIKYEAATQHPEDVAREIGLIARYIQPATVEEIEQICADLRKPLGPNEGFQEMYKRLAKAIAVVLEK